MVSLSKKHVVHLCFQSSRLWMTLLSSCGLHDFALVMKEHVFKSFGNKYIKSVYVQYTTLCITHAQRTGMST